MHSLSFPHQGVDRTFLFVAPSDGHPELVGHRH